MGYLSNGTSRRARRALERQLEYQQAKARRLTGNEAEWIRRMIDHSLKVRAKIGAFRCVEDSDSVLEVGCGAQGLIFFFGTDHAVGIDPLADQYAQLFPKWQTRVRTIASGGEQLPFPKASFDIVLCDNVVDHAESPRRILEEISRVLKPGGVLYFTVHIHHPFYHFAASAHAAWRALGIPFEIAPFADHTVHLTARAAERLFDELPLRPLSLSENIAETRRRGRKNSPRHAGDLFKRLFYKNAKYEVLAERLP